VEGAFRENRFMSAAPYGFLYRKGISTDALCVGVLATQVFLDTYATAGIRAQLAREVLAEYSPDAFARRLADQRTTFILAEREGHLVGFAEVVHERPFPLDPPDATAPTVELVRLYVQPAFQRHGLGRDLLREAERLADTSGSRGLWLAAWSGNDRALAFYRALGYVPVGTVEHRIEGEAYENVVLAKPASSG
jgi:GNAT superfamily N-acetyltransferase